MPSASSLFCCLFVSEIYFWKYSRIALEIYGEFLFATMKYQSEGELEGRPTGQRRPPAAAQGGLICLKRIYNF